MPPDPALEHAWLTLAEHGELLLHINERHVRHLVAQDRVSYPRLGGRFRFSLARVEGRLDQNSDEPDWRTWRGTTT